jgi:uncharacterized membrane protein
MKKEVSGVLHKENNNTFKKILHPRTFSQRAADNIAKWAGSWVFIIGFLIFLGIWMAANVYAWINAWDPYPFILLNLVLSCIAALQAPVILMSQNRQSQKDRVKAEYDYRVNRKAEKYIEDILKRVKKIEIGVIKKPKK